MIAINSFAIGAGIGLACLGGLWLSVKRFVTRSEPALTAIWLNQAIRSSVVVALFCALALRGPVPIVAGLAGFRVARRLVLRRLLQEITDAK